MKENVKKALKPAIILFIASILLFLYNFFMFDFIIRFDNPGARAAAGLLFYILALAYLLTALAILIFVFIKIKKIKFLALIHVGIVALTILFFTYIPFTEPYQKLYFATEKNQLKETIQMLQEDKLIQIDEVEYIAPYRLTSHTGTIYAEYGSDSVRARFSIYRGFNKSCVLLYTTSANEIDDSDFSFGSYDHGYYDIKKLAPHWYTALRAS